MNVEHNHTILHVRDVVDRGARGAAILGRAEPPAYAVVVLELELDNRVSLDDMQSAEETTASTMRSSSAIRPARRSASTPPVDRRREGDRLARTSTG